MVDGAGQRRGRQYGDLVLPAYLADLERDLVHPLGQHLGRRPGLALIVLQGHRIVGRVGDDDIGLGHVPHHAARRHLHLQAPDAPLHLGLALGVLVLVLDLLLGHLELAGMIPALEGDIDGDDGQQGAAEDDQHPQKQLEGIYDAAGEGLQGEVEQVIELARQHPPGKQGDEQDLGDGLDQLHQGLHPEHPLETGEGAELAPLGHHGLTGEVEASEQGIADEGRQGHQGKQQTEGKHHLADQGRHHGPHGAGVERLLPLQGKAHGHHLEHGGGQGLLDHQQPEHGGQQHAGGAQLLGSGDLPLLPGLL